MGSFYSRVRELHIEPTTKCNARCPMCPRTLGASPYTNTWLEETDIDLDKLEKTFSNFDLRQISINGNYGDIVMHNDPLRLVKLCSKIATEVVIHTNGGAQSKDFWKELAGFPNLQVIFAIDGLEDTHSLYRRNTRFETVIKNAKTFIKHGGTAHWDMLVFNHNKHQIRLCKQLAKDLGFKLFNAKPNARYSSSPLPVVDKNFDVEYYIDSIPIVKQNFQTNDVKQVMPKETYKLQKKGKYPKSLKKLDLDKEAEIKCRVIDPQSIFISAYGKVYPCCWVGQLANKNNSKLAPCDFNKIFKNKNTLENLTEIVDKFDVIKNTWNKIPMYECSLTCSVENKHPGWYTTKTAKREKL
jgi:MoaA/NifB/PqqE/SkfB family radical SAM enzyme